MQRFVTGTIIGLFSAGATIALAVALCALSGKTWVEAMGFPLTWNVFLWLALGCCLAAIIREK